MSNLYLPLIALQFLTRLPIRLGEAPTPEQFGRATLFYPLVGLLMGAALGGLGWWLGDTLGALHAALILAAWVAFSGALHLDGLADTADAWVGGLGDRERTLAIMKDPRSGPVAVVVLVMILLLKFAAILTLLEKGHLWPLLLAPWLARTALPLLFLTTPYARPGGLGQALSDHLPRRALPWMLGLNVLLMPLTGLTGVVAIGVALAVFIWWRSRLMARLDGTTGDTAGALVELVECAVLVAMAI